MPEMHHKPRRGRPKRQPTDNPDTRDLLLRAGMIWLTQSGFSRSGIDGVLKSVNVPKGSFYYYFESKEAFGIAVLDRYRRYFEAKLDGFLLDQSYPPLERLERFAHDAQEGLLRHNFTRGCLVGNLEQEVSLLPEVFRALILASYSSWQKKVEICLQEAKRLGDISVNLEVSALAEVFWIGWEGAVHRARLSLSNRPLEQFFQYFMASLKTH